MTAKPSLQDIANMPFPASVKALRTHYDKYWGQFPNDVAPTEWEVTVRYSTLTYDCKIYDIVAPTAEAAKALAEDKWKEEDKDEDDDLVGIDAEACG